MRKRYIQDPETLELVPAEEYVPKHYRNESAYIIQDTIQPYFNHASKEWVDSKTKHRRILRQHGLVEVGNENLSKHIKKPDPYKRDDVKQDIAKVLSDYGV